MAENEQTKVCPLCAETIKVAARVCPYCRKVQRSIFFATAHDVLPIVTALLFVGIVILLLNIFAYGRDFSSSKDKITVLSSQLAIEATHDYTNVVVAGVLTNASDYSWILNRFEVRFFNTDGALIDADSSGSGITILPHAEASFRLTLYSRKSIPESSSHKVLVSSASEPGIWFPAGD